MRKVIVAVGSVLGSMLYAAYRLPAHAQEQVQERLFASPNASNAVATSTGASLSKMTLALVVVLGCVFLAAWVLKQTRRLQGGKLGGGIEIISQVGLGAKERAVLLKVGNAYVLVGVAPGQVNALHVMPASEATSIVDGDQSAATAVQMVDDAGTSPSSFKAILKRSLGLS
jgi:flagellar biosynthetic protein FliO